MVALVKVIHGLNDDVFDLPGAVPVSIIRRNLRDAFNIPAEAIAFVNGVLVLDDFRLLDDDTLEFVVPWGRKEGSSFFRYPGGKYKLRRPIIDLIAPQLSPGIEYREPFFGGGGIGLQLLEEFPERISSLWINDRDIGIATLWTSVIRFPEDLQRRVMSFVPTPERFAHFKRDLLQIDDLPKSRAKLVEIGFRKLAIQQMSYSGLGVMAGGPLSDIGSRWSPEYICSKIEKLSGAFATVDVRGGGCSSDDFEAMLDGDDCLVYLDPPYYVQGAALYQHAFDRKDHERLALALRRRKGPWLLSYDDCPEVRELYRWATAREVPVNYSISQANKRAELLIMP